MLNENYISVKYETSSFWTTNLFMKLEMMFTSLNFILSKIKMNKNATNKFSKSLLYKRVNVNNNLNWLYIAINISNIERDFFVILIEFEK